MGINIEFLVVAYFIGLFVDWVFQWQWQAENKSKWGASENKSKSLLALISHSFVYAFLTAGSLLMLTAISLSSFTLVFLVLLISHAVIDTRIPVKWILKFKGLSDEQIVDYQNFGFLHVGIDHRLHELTLLILAFFV